MTYAIGFTGTQRGMTQYQKDVLRRLLDYCMDGKVFHPDDRVEFHHGDCDGADAEAHDVAIDYGFWIVVHPPENSSKRAWKTGNVILPVRPYLVRNRAIVDSVGGMIATPGEMTEQLRSGTWSTVRYAESKGIITRIILPLVVDMLPEA